MTPRRSDPLGTLARYVLVTRISAAALSLVALIGRPSWRPALTFAFALLIGLNYLALRHWTAVLARLRISAKPYYLALDSGLALALIAVVGNGTPLVLYLVGAGLLSGLIYRARVAAIETLTLLGGYAVVLAGHTGIVPGDLTVHTVLTLPAMLIAAGLAGVAVKRLLLRQERAAREIAELREVAAVREERLRMARDLHDTVTKNLHGVWLLSRGVQSALARGDLAAAHDCAAVVGGTAQALAEQSRTVIRGLRDDGPRPFADLLSDVVRRATSGFPVTVDLDADPVDVPDREVRHEASAIVSEAVHNALKHAGPARITVAVAAHGEQVRVRIEDDGCGFAMQPRSLGPGLSGHFGLLGMKERAARIGGVVTVHSRPGRGTRVELTAPRGGPPPAGLPPTAAGSGEAGWPGGAEWSGEAG